MEKKEIIRQDINFLEYNLWVPREKNRKTVYEIQDSDKYKLVSYKGLPNKVDMMILYYILLESQNKKYKRKIKLSMHKILKGCDIHPTKEKKERLKESLDRWHTVNVSFKGVFYNGIKYETLNFHIIDSWSIIEGENEVEIKFNEEWLYKIKNSNFFKWISFSEMKHLRNPTAIRLYEILSKSFYKRDKWEISAHKLAQKMGLTQKYFSKIEEKITPCINIINEKTSLNIKLSVRKTGKNEGIFTFKKIFKTMAQLMKEEREYEGIKQENAMNEKEIKENFTENELESYKNEFISKEIKKNKYLSRIYNTKGFNKVIETSFYSYLSHILKNKKTPENE